MKKIDKKTKKIDMHDILFAKLSIIAFVLFILSLWPLLMNWVVSVHWGWFLGAAILFGLRPLRRFWI